MMNDKTDILIVENLVKRYGETVVLDGVALHVAPGETVAVIGPSGAGKSTLLNIIGALDTPTAGVVRLGDIEVTALREDALAAFRAEKVGFVFQDHHLLPQLTALENVLLPTLAASPKSKIQNPKSTDATNNARELLQRVGVEHRQMAFPAQMSGGERQRVAVARALINGAHLLLCDEPTGNLDRENGERIIALLLELAMQGVAVIMATHHTGHAAQFSRCLELRDGQLTQITVTV
jgi:ABC-type lipoprotein export system ATPase subunit